MGVTVMDNFSEALRKIDKLEDYLKFLCKFSPDILLCIVTKEPQGKIEVDAEAKKIGNIKYLVKEELPCEFITDDMLKNMLSLGMLDLREKANWNYIFAKHNDKIISNKISEPGGMVSDILPIGTSELELTSKSFSKGNEAIIAVDGKNFCVNHHGINIVVIDYKGGRLLDSVAFDTTTDKCECFRHPDMFYKIYGYSLVSKNFLNWINYAEKWLFRDLSVEKIKSSLIDIEDIISYMHMLLLIRDKYMIILAVKDTPGSYMSDELFGLIQQLGFSRFSIELWRMYIGIVSEGQVLFDTSASNLEESVCCECVNKNKTVKIHVESRAYRNGNVAKILVGGKDYAVNKRGVNIIVINPVNGEVIDSVAIDTHTENYKFYRA